MPALAGAASLSSRRSACSAPHGSRGRSSRALGVVHALDLPAPPLAAGTLDGARRSAALGRAGLDVGPHEHRPAPTPERWGDVCPHGRHQPQAKEKEEHRPSGPPPPSEGCSHARLSGLHGWTHLLGLQRGDIFPRASGLAAGALPARAQRAPLLRLLGEDSEEAAVEVAAPVVLAQAEAVQMHTGWNAHGLGVRTTDGGDAAVEAGTLHGGLLGSRLGRGGFLPLDFYAMTRRAPATTMPRRSRRDTNASPGTKVSYRR